MKADFDNAAANYDVTFTNSVIGKLQRSLVYEQLQKIIKQKKTKTIIEINCGTGEDAIWLAKQNFDVVATDISATMIEIAKSKTNLENVTFKKAAINSLSTAFSAKNFDFLLSNFGGLNCLSKEELAHFFSTIPEVLTTNSQVFLVIMPKNTLWESFYFASKLDFKNAFRRKKEHAIANVDGEKVTTYYYNPKDIVNLANANFKVKLFKPIGLFVPPSYLEPFFKNKPKLLSFLNALEQKVKNQSWLSKYADHYVILLEKK
jgi:trans-aconitate methyltransferase